MEFNINKENEGQCLVMSENESSGSEYMNIKKKINKHRTKYKKKPIRREKEMSPVSSESNHSLPPSKNPGHQPLRDTTFEMFSNPNKIHRPRNDEGYEESEHMNESENESVYNEDNNEEYYETKAGEGFKSVEEEKQDLIYKFFRLSSKGIPLSKKFNINSDLQEMRTEYSKIKRDLEVNSSIKFSRRMLMACVTGLEFVNTRYDPFDIHLEGWSESVMENVTDYDNIFERLHDKYANKVSMPPEMELLMTLAGSAFMFHLTNTMFKSLPNIGQMAKENPDVLKSMMDTMTKAANVANSNKSENKPQESSSNKTEGPREMKKPSFDISSILPPSMLPSPIIPDFPLPVTTKPEIIDEDKSEISSIHDDVSSISNYTKNVSITEGTVKKKRKARKSTVKSTDVNTITI
jgi:hypothetical protein